MKKVSRFLLSEMYAFVIIALIIVVIYESDLFAAGILADNNKVEFILTFIMELVTICVIPVSLRLFKFRFVIERLKAKPEKEIKHWGGIRLLMLCIPMVINTLLYYWTGFNVAFGYMAIILLLCLAFVYPSEDRCNSEIQKLI